MEIRTAWILLVGLLFASCEKEELPISPRTPGPELIAQVNMGSDYGQQIFYRLSDNSVVSQNPKTAWDIGFECGEDGWRIILNTARGGAAALVETNDFSSVTSISGAGWNWDAHSGNPDSTAIGDYRNTDYVILIDRGYDPQGNHTGYRKMKVLDVDETSYSIRFAALNGTNDITTTIEKSPTQNYQEFSFDENNSVEIAPDKTQWDLLFTQYIHLFTGPLTPYLVTGVLINRHETIVAKVTDRVFSDIQLEDIQQYELKSDLDVIGYNWKAYSFETASYAVNPDITYIIRNSEGRHFKLHFIDFYDDLGARGAPKFEMQEL
jgi:hypothetical protein